MSIDDKDYTFEERRRGREGSKKCIYDVFKVDKASGASLGPAIVKTLTLAEALRVAASLREWDPKLPEEDDVTGLASATVETMHGIPEHQSRADRPSPGRPLRVLRADSEPGSDF